MSGIEGRGRDRTAPLCEHKVAWDWDGTVVKEYTECAADAVGRFRYTDPHGADGEFDFCEDHIPDDAERIERYQGTGSDRGSVHQIGGGR